jgi:hypothetical protein
LVEDAAVSGGALGEDIWDWNVGVEHADADVRSHCIVM